MVAIAEGVFEIECRPVDCRDWASEDDGVIREVDVQFKETSDVEEATCTCINHESCCGCIIQ